MQALEEKPLWLHCIRIKWAEKWSKNCALQYSELLEKVETPKRKRGEREVTETPGDVIVRKLTIERIEELKRIVQDEQVKYRKMKREVETARSGQTDEKLKEIWEEIQNERKAAEEVSAIAVQKLPADIATKAQGKTQNKPVATPSRPKKAPPSLKLKIEALIEADDNTQDSTASVTESTITSEEDSIQTIIATSSSAEISQPVKMETPGGVKPKPTPPPSPLLSSLLQNSLALQEALQKQLQQQTQVAPPQPAEKTKEITGSVDEKTDQAAIEPLPAPPVQVKQESPVQVKVEPPVQVPHDGTTAIVAKTPQTVAPPEVDETPKTEAKETVDVEVDVVTKVDEPSTPVQVETETTTVTESPKPQEAEKEDVPGTHPCHPVSVGVKERKKEEKAAEGMDEDTVESIASPPPTTPELSPPIDMTPRPSASGKGKGPLLNLRPPTMDTDEPASPASSVVSNDTEDMVPVKVKVTHRNKGGRPRGRKSRRLTRSKLVVEDEKKELETSSRVSEEQESSDDEILLPDPDRPSTKLPASVIESFPNSPASITHSDTEDERAHKTWKKSIMLVWRSAANHKYANVFLHPVTEDIAPGYHSVVFRPMNLSTIKKNIETGEVRTTAEFQRDMMLMFTNAIMYNNSDHNVYHMAVEMYNDVMVHIEQYVNTQMMVVQTETKVLRTSRRSDAAVSSDKEEDIKKKRMPQDHDSAKTKKRKI
ncbi:hypothetical protein LSAT2_013161 [Lamellibrachia satsuma]|nr:hypothetical protein LSAT2_013161 [Lamellibrachia satsuma]